MVFGFGKKKVNTIPDAEIQKERHITINDIKQILIDAQRPSIDKIIAETKELKENTLKIRKNIHEIIIQLEKDDLKLDDVDKNLRVIINRGKNSVITIIKKETTSNFTNIVKMDDVFSFNNELNQMVKRIGDVLGLNTRIMHVFAKKYADDLKNEIAKVATLQKSLQKIIFEHRTMKENSVNIEKLTDEYLELKKSIEQKTHRLSEIDDEIKQTNQIIKELNDSISELKLKKEYSEFLKIKSEIGVLESEKSDIKNKIDIQFSKISRPLGKYFYISSFDKPIKKIMEDLIKEPYDVITSKNKDAIIEILQAVSKSTLAGNLSVKDTEKSVEYIQETISRLDEFLELKNAYLVKITNLQKDLDIFNMDALTVKELDLQKYKTNIPRLEETRSKLEKELNDANVRLNEIIVEITSNLSRITNIKIILN